MKNKSERDNRVKEIEFLLEKWMEVFNSIQATYDSAYALLKVSPEAPMIRAMYDAFQGYTDQLGINLGDQGGWLDWFLWDNDGGKNEYEVTITSWKRKRHIRNVKDLAQLIVDDAHKESRIEKT